MPRVKKVDASNEPKRRSRTGCHNCKARKIKCDESRPTCGSCTKLGETCDYSVQLRWGGRSKKDQDAFTAMANASPGFSQVSFGSTSVAPTSSTAPPTSNPPFTVQWQASSSERTTVNKNAVIDPQLANMDHHTEYATQSGSAANRFSTYPEPSNAYNTLPRFPLPYSSGSPSEQNFQSPSTGMSPPLLDFSWKNQDRSKRARLSTGGEFSRTLPPPIVRPDQADSPGTYNSPYDRPSPGAGVFTSYTAGSARSSMTHGSPAVRRLSVNSLLSGPPGDYSSPGSCNDRNRNYRKVDNEGYIVYGYDYGMPDLDMPKNDDHAAINPQTPATAMQSPSGMSDIIAWSPSQPLDSTVEKPAFEKGGYYARPVPIRISRDLEPLPSLLADSPMNLIYFHHFLNHTARILVPHDCPDNPMKTTLPQMAVKNANLLNLLLAYSASHRARLLCHAEPANRIATWLRDVFPDLRRSLSANTPVSNATLATSIMLASRECINPNSLDVPIPWQTHLQISRQMIISRGGLRDMGGSGDPFVNFLARWFAYLDVIGSLSGPRNEAPLSSEYLLFSKYDGTYEEGFAIDCFFGFSNCCISLLARVARLAHECDSERIDDKGNVDTEWQPSAEVTSKAEELQKELLQSRWHVHRGCRHNRNTDKDEEESEKSRLELQEMVSVNEMFHLAGLIHVYKRVLGKPAEDEGVQECVKVILQALQGVRRGGTAESSLLFPMFTAGCDARDLGDREVILERLKLVEGLGMMHVRKARQLMEKSWETGRAWETLAAGEFIG